MTGAQRDASFGMSDDIADRSLDGDGLPTELRNLDERERVQALTQRERSFVQ
jgi:hypothetical protein